MAKRGLGKRTNKDPIHGHTQIICQSKPFDFCECEERTCKIFDDYRYTEGDRLKENGCMQLA
jgi:hypothetical protein